MKRTRLAVIGAVAALILGACGDAGEEGGGGEAAANEYEVVENPELTGAAAELAEAGEITIGVKYDQPGIGFKGATDDVPTGFDPEMGKIIAGQLGLEPDAIQWEEAISDNREPFLQQNTVDLVIASYSITDERRQVVGQAGPYYVTGQSLLVAADDDSIAGPDDLNGKKVCSVTGSTSIATVEEEYGAEPAGFDTYSECVDQLKNGSVDAVTTDGAILLGYAAEDPDALKVVGEPFSEERYGIGYNKDAEGMCEFLNDAMTNAFENGDWQKAFDSTLGQSGNEAGDPPELDPCE
jgi:glutamate transport system substrate-binding protein